MSNVKKYFELAGVRWLSALVLAGWPASGILGAATYFVAPNGNDSQPGSISAPFQTIARAYRQAGPGDAIVLQDGVYRNSGRVSDRSGGMHGYVAQVALSKAGATNAWITIRAEHKRKAILDCGTTPATIGCDVNIYLDPGAAYWSFEDLVLTGGAFGGISTDFGASHIRVTGCEFYNIGNWNNPTRIGESGVGFNRAAQDWWIEGNVFHDIGRIGGSGLDHGIYAAGTDVTVINNVFFSLTHGWAIQVSDGAHHWLIANNTFAFPNPTRDGHIMLWNNNSGIAIRNNIFYEPRGYAIARYDSTLKGCRFDHNLVYGAQRLLEDFRDCAVYDNQIGADPLFVNPSKVELDFHLSAGSPAIGAGVSVAIPTGRPDGRSPSSIERVDLGAYPFGAVRQ